jgi:tRNA (guanine37-N1)-methyltransferase
MKFEIVTIFPDFFRGPLDYGIVRRARDAGLIEIGVHDLRAFTHDRHRTVDDRPFGGGEGMVLKPEPIFECLQSLAVSSRDARLSRGARETVILLSPQGELFTQKLSQDLMTRERVVLICGRYEGVDERVAEHLADDELSIGDYVLSGGELAAAVVIDAVARLLSGVVGNSASTVNESFEEGVLDYPQWTRPANFRGWAAPETLLGGNHEQIRKWRREAALAKTRRMRPDLLPRS